MDRTFTPESLISMFQVIDREDLDLILVGGQAINMWATYYVSRVPQLAEYLPFASAYLDFYGGKVEAIGLPQEGRQDLKHLQMSLLFVRAYIKDILEDDVRQGLKLIERIAFNIWSDTGLSVWYRYGIEINSAIPTGVEINTADPKWHNFLSIRLPQIERETVKKRGKYSDIQLSIEVRMADRIDSANDPN